jgi:hypothetical protein
MDFISYSETAMGVNKSTQESGFDYAMAVMK